MPLNFKPDGMLIPKWTLGKEEEVPEDVQIDEGKTNDATEYRQAYQEQQKPKGVEQTQFHDSFGQVVAWTSGKESHQLKFSI